MILASDIQFSVSLAKKVSFDAGQRGRVLTYVSEVQFWPWLSRLSFDLGWRDSGLTLATRFSFDLGWQDSGWTLATRFSFDRGQW